MVLAVQRPRAYATTRAPKAQTWIDPVATGLASRRGTHAGTADPHARPGDGRRRSGQRDRRGLNNALALIGLPPLLGIPGDTGYRKRKADVAELTCGVRWGFGSSRSAEAITDR